MPENQRVHLGNKRQEHSNIFRPEEAIQKIKSSPVSVLPLGRGWQSPGKDKSYNDRFLPQT